MLAVFMLLRFVLYLILNIAYSNFSCKTLNSCLHNVSHRHVQIYDDK